MVLGKALTLSRNFQQIGPNPPQNGPWNHETVPWNRTHETTLVHDGHEAQMCEEVRLTMQKKSVALPELRSAAVVAAQREMRTAGCYRMIHATASTIVSVAAAVVAVVANATANANANATATATANANVNVNVNVNVNLNATAAANAGGLIAAVRVIARL